MTEETISEVSDVQPEAVETPEAEAETPEQPVPEKTLTQTEANQIAARVKREAYERGMRDARSVQQSQPQHEITEDDRINRLVDERAQHHARMQTGQKIASEFLGKLETAKERHPEIENMVDELRLVSDEHAHLIPWLNGLENTADVVAELHENPSKFANLLGLARDLPHVLPRELHKLSVGIKRNAEAKKIPVPNEPLSQIKPSGGRTDSGELSVSERRKQPWARG